MREERPTTLQLSGHLPCALQLRYRNVLSALDGLTVGEQLEVATQAVIGILGSARLRAEPSHDALEDFDLLCREVEEWLEVRVGALRHTHAE
jgi:hypothetical protein